MASLHPQNGARVVLERAAIDEGSATYTVTVYEPDGVLQSTLARFSEEGVTVEPWERELDAWLAVFTDRLLKSFAKSHAGGPWSREGWPRKITRWRAERS
ncbi:MAG: hypothetical protein H6719_10400 [Sandaracinaceae bacterium]|nr:hypothetical protein [Sandaracinaceae bacterium]